MPSTDQLRSGFASYSSNDRDAVTRFANLLRTTGIELFLDHHHLIGGDDWWKSVSGAIEVCDVFYLFWSATAEKSRWVGLEIQHALAQIPPKRIVPVLLDDTPVPPELSQFQYVAIDQPHSSTEIHHIPPEQFKTADPGRKLSVDLAGKMAGALLANSRKCLLDGDRERGLTALEQACAVTREIVRLKQGDANVHASMRALAMMQIELADELLRESTAERRASAKSLAQSSLDLINETLSLVDCDNGDLTGTRMRAQMILDGELPRQFSSDRERQEHAMATMKVVGQAMVLDKLTVAERAKANEEFRALGWKTILEDVEYLAKSLPPGHPHQEGGASLLENLRRIRLNGFM